MQRRTEGFFQPWLISPLHSPYAYPFCDYPWRGSVSFSPSFGRILPMNDTEPSAMTLQRHAHFPCTGLASRHVDVWLPPGYDEGEALYPVLYMHDGQNICVDADAGFGVSWGVAGALTRLIAEAAAPPAIVVGVWNAELMRYPEYRPAKPFGYLSLEAAAIITASLGGMPQSDAYLSYLVNELKPFIDATYRTLPGREHTSIMGSSMGGLISLYALCEYPEVYGAAGCVSSHWPAVEGVMLPYLAECLPDPATHRIYFDYGTTTLDALYEPMQLLVDRQLEAAGYERGRNWVTLRFDGAGHDEASWAARVHIPLRFLLAGEIEE